MPVRNITYYEPAGPDWATRAFAGPEALYKAQVMEHTWGHLSPVQGTNYYGWLNFIVGCHGDNVVIEYEFKDADGNELSGNPWSCEDMHDWIFRFSQTKRCVEGRAYQFVGRYKQYRTTGNYSFSGKVQMVRIPKPRIVVRRRKHALPSQQH